MFMDKIYCWALSRSANYEIYNISGYWLCIFLWVRRFFSNTNEKIHLRLTINIVLLLAIRMLSHREMGQSSYDTRDILYIGDDNKDIWLATFIPWCSRLYHYFVWSLVIHWKLILLVTFLSCQDNRSSYAK